jgi:hypothetical protein
MHKEQRTDHHRHHHHSDNRPTTTTTTNMATNGHNHDHHHHHPTIRATGATQDTRPTRKPRKTPAMTKRAKTTGYLSFRPYVIFLRIRDAFASPWVTFYLFCVFSILTYVFLLCLESNYWLVGPGRVGAADYDQWGPNGASGVVWAICQLFFFRVFFNTN